MRKAAIFVHTPLPENLCTMSELALELIRENKKTKNPFLDLGNCGLRKLPDELFNCIWLQHLNLGAIYVDHDIFEWAYTKNIGLRNTVVKVRNNLDKLKKLTQLQGLYLDGNNILDISFLQGLTQLRTLVLSDNNISDIIFLKGLIQLRTLDLSNNKISDVAFLKRLTQLQTLNLSRNIVSKIDFIGRLTQLQNLSLSNNNISDYSFLVDLTQLQALDLSNNKILDHSFLKDFTQLQTLNLSNNNISDYNFLKYFTQLQILELSNNKILDINFLKNLEVIQTLDLSSNQIVNIQVLENLSLLRNLNLGNNKISDISPLLTLLKSKNSPAINLDRDYFLTDYNGKNKINLHNNPLTNPPIEVVQQGNKAVLNYFSELEKQGQDYLYEAKMLIVGQPRAGKTSLRYKLFNQGAELPEEEKTTRGIDIESLEFDIKDRDGKPRKFKYNVWDFGGQQIYQSTHQFFLTHRSLYALVMDTGKDSVGNDDSTMNYWLQAVELLGGNSPMLLLLNQKNERSFTVDLAPKRIRFEFLKKAYSIDLNALIPKTMSFKTEQEKAFREFKEDIETELKRLPLVGFPMPKNWVKIREELQQLSQEKSYIYRQDYVKICEAHDVIDYELQRQLSGIFHDLGVFLHFQEHPALEEFIILQNVWATDAVFAVLDNPDVIANHGKFTDADLASIWQKKQYESSVHRKLLELMKQFELCYQVENSSPREYIIPEMLAKESPKNYAWQPQDDLPLQYHYDFMPKGILTRFIVRLHRHIARDQTNQQIVWKSGVKIDGTTLDCPGTVAEITEAWDNKQLLVRVQGKFPKELMSKLTYEIDAINADFFKQVSRDPASQKSRWYKMIPCICRTCKGSMNKHFYDYSELLDRKEFGKNTIECKLKPFEAVSISELLDGVFSKQSTRQAENNRSKNGAIGSEKQAKKIFISYSHKDETAWKDEVVKHLAALRNQDLIEDWTDRQIEPGQWNEQIEKAMEEADIFLLLITHNFLSSKYISSREITTAYRRFKEGKAKIFPIICDSCEWNLQPVTKEEKEFNTDENREMYVWLGKFQAFPKDARPIKNWPNSQDGFVDVVKQLRKYL